jgi:hypothetical protein
MIVIADTTPLNYLVLIDQPNLLPRLYGRVLIPPAVPTPSVAAWSALAYPVVFARDYVTVWAPRRVGVGFQKLQRLG